MREWLWGKEHKKCPGDKECQNLQNQTITGLSLPLALSSHLCGHSSGHKKRAWYVRAHKKKNQNKEVSIQCRHIRASVKIPNTGCNFMWLSDTGKNKMERNLSIASACFQRTIWFIYVPEARTTTEFLCRKSILTMSPFSRGTLTGRFEASQTVREIQNT